MEDSEYKKALTNYYKSKGGGNSIFGFSPEGEKEPSFLGRIFGGDNEDKPALSDNEQGMKNILSARSQAERAGRFDVVGKIDDMLSKNKHLLPGGSGKASAPEKTDRAPKPQPQPPVGQSGNLAAGEGSNGYTPSASEIPNGVPKQLNFNPDVLKGVETGEKQETLASLDPYKQQDGALDLFEDTSFTKNGGMITAAHAALGGMMRNPVQQAALGDAPTSAVGEPMEQEPPPPAEEEPQDPAVTYPEEDEDNFAKHGITRQLADRAVPAVAAVVQKASVAPQGAIPDGSEARPQPVKPMSHEEVKAIDQMIDPENKLPPEAKAAARVSAMWDFYSERDPEKAADAVNSLLAYDKQNSMTRGQLALDALQKGDNQTALDVLRDGHNNDVPGGSLIQKAVLRQDGGANITIQHPDGSTEEMPATVQQIAQTAQSAANGTAYNQQLQEIVRRHDAAKGGTPKQGIDSSLFKSWDQARTDYARKLDAVTKDPSEENKKAFEDARSRAVDAEGKAREWAYGQKDPRKALSDLGLGNIPLDAGAPSPKGPPRAPTYPKPPNLKADEKAAKEFDATIGRHFGNLADAQKLIESGHSVDKDGKTIPRANPNAPVTPEERAAAEKSVLPFQHRNIAAILNTHYNYADDTSSKDDAATRRPSNEELDKALTDYFKATDGKGDKERSIVTRTGKDEYFRDRQSPDERNQALAEDRNQMLRIGRRLSKKNDVDPKDLARFMDGFVTGAQAPKYDLDNGRVNVGNVRLYIDRDSFQDLTVMRRDHATETAKVADEKRYKGALDLGIAKGNEQGDRKRMEAEIAETQAAVDAVRKRNEDYREAAKKNNRPYNEPPPNVVEGRLRQLQTQYGERFRTNQPDDGGLMPKYPGVSLP